MSVFSSPKKSPDISLEPLESADPRPQIFRDRSTPFWATALSLLFSLGGGVCLFAIAVFLVFFYELVAQEGQQILAPLLSLGAMVPIVGLLIFDVGHAKALAGYRHVRNRNVVVGKAFLGVLAGVVFAFLQPMIAIPFVVGGVLSWVFCHLTGRFLKPEPAWEFLPQEATSFLTGRDQRALDLAHNARHDNILLDGFQKFLGYGALISAAAVASWLTANEILNVSAIATIVLITFWSVDAFAAYFRQMSHADPELVGRAKQVTLSPAPYEADAEEPLSSGVFVHHLSVMESDGTRLLSDISFHVQPGMIIGISGDSFAGKSLLLQAMNAPHDLTGLMVDGHVTVNGTNLWTRTAKDRALTAVMVPPEPLFAPGGGANNLSCFLDGIAFDRAKRELKSLVFTSDTVNRIVQTNDVATLSRTEQKAMALARAFALRPQLILLDRPEDGASEALLGALAQRAAAETKLGNIILMVTENRLLLERCDKLLMMQSGRLIEYASTSEIHARLSAGWMRFVTERDLESEEPLDAWLCSQFRRDGDEANRRAICMVANEMLTVACQSHGDSDTKIQTISFEFKHHAGHCLLRLCDNRLVVSSGALEKARIAADTSVDGERLSPLAKIVRDSLDVESFETDGKGCLQVTIKTYDPRLLGQRKVAKDETKTR